MVTLMLLACSACISQPGNDELGKLAREYSHALGVYEAHENGGSDYGRIFEEERRPAKIYRFMELLRDEEARKSQFVDALVWVSKMSPTWGSREPLMGGVGDRARRLLIRHHIQHPRIGLALSGLMFLDAASETAEALFRAALSKSPHREVRGRACYWLGMYLKNQAECVSDLKQSEDGPKLQQKFEKRWGKDAVERLKGAQPDKLLKEAQLLFERAIESYPDVTTFGWKNDDAPLASEAAKELHEVRDLALGRMAPEIVGRDADGTNFKLSDYRGNVVLLTFSGNWCGPCRAMYSEERDLVKRLHGKRFVILSVNTDPDVEVLRKSQANGEITWRCWWDGSGRPICREWNVSAFPTIYVIDAGGVIRHKNIRGCELEKALDDLVHEEALR